MSNSEDNNDYKLSQFQRNRYFYGKLMSVRDFETEQGYMNEKRNLINRVINGAGIICGFSQGDLNLSTDDGKLKITFIKGGVALDCSGREIVVPKGSIKDVLIRKVGEAKPGNFTPGSEDENATYYLYLEYNPRDYELVSSAEDPTGTEGCVYNRVIEDFQVIASTKPPTAPSFLCTSDEEKDYPTIVCPDLSDYTKDQAVEAEKFVKDWLKDKTSEMCSVCVDEGVFIHAFDTGKSGDTNVPWNNEETGKYLSFIHNNKLQSELLACHLADFKNPHKSLVSVDGVGIEDELVDPETVGNVDLVPDNTITIEPNCTSKTITIGENHSGLNNRNPHQTTHEELVDVLEVDPEVDDDTRNKHVSNQDAKRWDEAAETAAAGLSSAGGMVTGTVDIKTTDWSALSGSATKTHGLLGRLTEDLDTGSDYRCAGVAGVSEINGKHGVYAKAPAGTHSLYVEGSALFTGSINGYCVNTFINASGTDLKRGAVVSLAGNPVTSFRGDNKIPLAEVTLAEEGNAKRIIGIVDRKALPEGDVPGSGMSLDELNTIGDKEELYVVTLGCYAHCKVDTSGGNIDVGDLLTPSATPGCARKAADPKIGTIIGKALEPYSGEGEEFDIAVFVNLQ